MANLAGSSESQISRRMTLHAGFILTVVGVLLFYSLDFGVTSVFSFRGIVVPAVIGLLLCYVSVRLNPLGWKKIFNKREYMARMNLREKVLGELNRFDEGYFVFYDFAFELFNVDCLIISPVGLFVLAICPCSGPFVVENDILYCGEKSLERMTANMWRICHLISIVFKKNFNSDILPSPLLV
ncbi:MAG TPA: NERD domain-containing protein, partial [Spirochaetes bacterium]|nr:NERD domain-containing protein [Spirochaetota bacterium]